MNWYNIFIDYLNEKNVSQLSEDIALEFLDYLKKEKQYKCSSIRSIWCGVKSIALVILNIDFDLYPHCRKWMKKNGKGEEPQQAPVFIPNDFTRFLELEDPDNFILREKVASIYGKFGRFRAIDYMSQHYNKFIEEFNGTAWIKLFTYS